MWHPWPMPGWRSWPTKLAPLTDAGAASLADPAGNDAGVVMDFTVLAPVETVQLPLLQGLLD